MRKLFGGSKDDNIACFDEAWEWDVSKKPDAVQITDLNLSVTRPTSDGKNPAIVSTKPLNKYNPHFRVKVETLGSWIGIGVVDSKFALNGAEVIGSQKDCVNTGYFCQTGAALKLQGEKEKKIDTNIEAGNIIDVYVDFREGKVLYWNNKTFLGHTHASKLQENTLYACANLSANTQVRFLNHDNEVLPVPKDLKPKSHLEYVTDLDQSYYVAFTFSPTLKADAVTLSDHDKTASRPSSSGSNPAVLGYRAITSAHNHFRLHVKSVGSWVGVGFAEDKYKLNDGETLGSQKDLVNCCYFQQTHSTLAYNNTRSFDVNIPIAANDIIDVLVDFKALKCYFWNNNRFVGVISLTADVTKTRIYPCVNLSTGTTITFIENASVPSIPSEAEQALASKTPSTPPTVPKATPSPVVPKANPSPIVPRPVAQKWQWSSLKKADAIVLADDNTSASRPSADGNNPVVLGTQPLSKLNNHFRVQVKSMGSWVGVGTLFSGDPIAANDIIDVLVDFNSSKVYFWNNDRFVGVISHAEVTLPPNEIYPCVNLSSTSTVVFVQNAPKPALPSESQLAQAKSKSSSTTSSPVVPKGSPAQNKPKKWQWSKDKKDEAITLDDDDTTASRPTTAGSNPAVLATSALTKTSPHFRVKVTELGAWVGIGVAESEYQLSGSKIIGKQTWCFNAGYFSQTKGHLQMNEKSDLVDIVVAAGDVIDVKVDFAQKKIYFWNNKRLVGTLEDNAIEEGKLFPCVQLAAKTAVTLTNVPEPTGLPMVKTQSPQTTPKSVDPVPPPAPSPQSPVQPKLTDSLQNTNLNNSRAQDTLVLLVEHESLKYPVKFNGNSLEDLHEHIFRIVKPQRAFKVAYWNQDFEDNMVLTDIRDLQNKMKLTLILTDARPAVVASSFMMTPLEKSDNEFDEVEMQFRADFQNHHEYYVAQRVKSNKLPITFVLINAIKVVNTELESKFNMHLEKMKSMGRTGEELKVRRAYHGTRATNVELICKNGLLKIGNPKNPSQATDPGWFGDPKKGIYVSRHVEYTTKYSNNLAHLEPGDRAKIIMFKVLPGKSLHVEQVTKGMSPTPGYDSHSSPNFLEWYLFDEAQCCPIYVLEVQAIENTRVKSDDGSKY